MAARILLALLVLVVRVTGSSWAAEPATFVEDFSNGPPAGMLGGSLLIGTKGAWSGAVENGTYRLADASDPTSIKTSTVHLSRHNGATPLMTASIEASVEVGKSMDNEAGAGLSFRHNDKDQSQYIFIVSMPHAYTIYTCDLSGCGASVSGTSEAIRPGANLLKAEFRGGASHFSIGGTEVATMSSDDIKGLDAGIAAKGRGTFVFRHVTYRSE